MISITPPASGSCYVVNACEPSDFHQTYDQSRFRARFLRMEGTRWIFNLRYALQYRGKSFTTLEIFPQNPMEPLTPDRADNTIVGRLLDKQSRSSDWFVGNLTPDVPADEPEPLVPDWIHKVFSSRKTP